MVRDGEWLAAGAREVTTHSEGLLALLDDVLNRANLGIDDLDGVVCGRGPGSFTGVRIGMATAKGLCFASGLPLYAVSSLVGVAGSAQAAEPTAAGARFAVILDARRHEVFCGLFLGAKSLAEECCLSPAAARSWLDQLSAASPAESTIIVAGDGALAYQDSYFAGLRFASAAGHRLNAGYLVDAIRYTSPVQPDQLPDVAPRYLRAPDIRRPKQSPVDQQGGSQ